MSIVVKLVVVVAVIVVVLVALARVFGRRARLRRGLAAARQWAIRDVPEGQVGRLAGMAAALGEPLVAPLSGRPCVYYDVRVQRHRGLETSDFFELEHELIAERRTVPFVLDDGTGRAIIDASHGDVGIGVDLERWSDINDPLTPQEEAFLARHGESKRGLILGKKLRFAESIIEVGERIAVVGTAVREPDPDAPPSEAYRGAPATRPVLTGTRRDPLLVSDEAEFAPPHDEAGIDA